MKFVECPDKKKFTLGSPVNNEGVAESKLSIKMSLNVWRDVLAHRPAKKARMRQSLLLKLHSLNGIVFHYRSVGSTLRNSPI